MNNLKIALAQFHPVKGTVEHNIEKHLQLIDTAVAENVDIIVFPELSLTGYEPELAKELEFTRDDTRLEVFKMRAKAHGITIIVGAPIKLDKDKPYIGEFVISPNSEPLYYCKMHFHKVRR